MERKEEDGTWKRMDTGLGGRGVERTLRGWKRTERTDTGIGEDGNGTLRGRKRDFEEKNTEL